MASHRWILLNEFNVCNTIHFYQNKHANESTQHTIINKLIRAKHMFVFVLLVDKRSSFIRVQWNLNIQIRWHWKDYIIIMLFVLCYLHLIISGYYCPVVNLSQCFFLLKVYLWMNDKMFELDNQSGIFIIYGHSLLLLLGKENEFFYLIPLRSVFSFDSVWNLTAASKFFEWITIFNINSQENCHQSIETFRESNAYQLVCFVRHYYLTRNIWKHFWFNF